MTDSELHDASTRVKTFALVTDILGIAAIVSGGVSLYLTLRPPSASATGVGASVHVAPLPGGLAAWGRF